MRWFDRLNVRFKKKEVPEVEEYKLKDKEIKKLSESFISRDEKYIASLGNGYIMNFFANKSIKRGFAYITNKRVYFKGSCLSGTGKHLVKTDEERTVDVKNITGSGFIYQRYWGILVALIISLITSLVGVGFSIYLSVDTFEAMSYFRSKVQSNSNELKLLEIVRDEWKEINWLDDFATDEIEGILDVKNEEWDILLLAGAGKDNVYVDSEEHLIEIEISGGGYRDSGLTGYAKHLIEEEIEEIPGEKNYNRKQEIHYFKWVILGIVAAVLSGGLGLICCIGIKNYLFKRKTLFRIEYAGGCIAFNVSFYAKAEIDDFQKQLRRAKDMAEESSTISDVTLEIGEDVSVQNKTVDDLRKYNELLKDGLITQEEYDAVKKNILGI